MKTALYILLSVFWGLAAAACATPPGKVPGETKRPVEERFHPDRYIVGRGCAAVTGEAARDRIEADQAARAEVAKQLEVKVIQVVEDMQREELRDEQRTRSYSVSVQTREFVDKTLRGIRIEERSRDEDRRLQCSVAVLDKTAMASQLRQEMERDLQELRAHLGGAQSAQGAGAPVDALRAYSLALLSADRVGVNAGMVVALGHRPPEGPSRAGILQKRTEVLDGIRLVRVGGEGQRAQPGAPLAEPLKLGAVERSGRPVRNLPVKVLRAPEGCEIQTEAQTGGGGEAELWVYRVVSNRIALEEIVLGIDWKRLMAVDPRDEEATPWGDWDTRELVFTYRIPVPSDYRVGVAVFESGSGRPLNASPIQNSVLEGLQRVGFQTRDLLSADSLEQRPRPEQARRLFAGKLDLLVLGDVSLRYSSESSGFTFYRARGVVEAIALATGRTVVTLDLDARGGGLDDHRAARMALNNLAERLKLEIGAALEGALD